MSEVPVTPSLTSRLPLVARWLCAGFFASVGVGHFINPAPYVSIVPASLPEPLLLVYISGFFELLGGIGLLVPRTRRMAGWGLLALLVAVYPANIYMLVDDIYLEGMPRERWLLWARMPMQFVFAAWVAWVAGIWPRRGPVTGD